MGKNRAWIPDNYKVGETLFGKPMQNYVEGGVACYLLYKGIMATPFIGSVKLGAVITLCLPVLGIGIFGINDESVLQYLFAYLKYRSTRKKMSYRKPQKQQEGDGKENETKKYKDASERIVETIRSKIKGTGTDKK